MKNELMIFEEENLEVLTKEDVNIDFEGNILMNGKQCSRILGYADNCTSSESERVNLSKAISTHVDDECKYVITKDLFRNQNSYENYTIGKRGEIFINDDGVFDLIYNSHLLKAKLFKKKVREIVNKVQQTGKYDSIEEQIQQIKDEKEKQMSLSLYTYEQALKINPNDMLTAINYNQTKLQLDTYKQQKILAEVKQDIGKIKDTVDSVVEDTKIIKEQQTYICNRTNFSERIRILANKYFGRDIQEAYTQLFGKMKLLGSFDVYAHRKHEWEKINAKRAKENKKPYKNSTLKGKCNYIDVIDMFEKWELASEAYKTIEMDFVKGEII